MKTRLTFRRIVNKKAENFFIALLFFWMIFVPFPTIAIFSAIFYKELMEAFYEDLLGNTFAVFCASVFSLAWTHCLCFDVYKLI